MGDVGNDSEKDQKLESARRFCDMMEEEEDISIAQSVAACRQSSNGTLRGRRAQLLIPSKWIY